MSTTDENMEKEPGELVQVQVVAMESNKAQVDVAVAAAPAHKQHSGAETNNNNISSSGGGGAEQSKNSCHESRELHERVSDRNSSLGGAGEQSSSSLSEGEKQRTSRTRLELDANQLHDKQQQQQDESSPAPAPGEQGEKDATTKVKSSSDFKDEKQRAAPVAAHGDMTAAAGGSGGGLGRGKNAQVAEDTHRDKQRAQAAASQQVEQTPQGERGAQQQRANDDSEAEAGRRPAVAKAATSSSSQVGEAAQGQGQGQAPMCADARAAKQTTNSVDQNKTLAAAGAIAVASQRAEDDISGKCISGTQLEASNSGNDNNNHLVKKQKNNNISTNGDLAGEHHILELNNNNNQHHHLNHHNHLETNGDSDQLPYFATATATTTADDNNIYRSYFKSHTPQSQHKQTQQTTTKRLSYLQALLLRKWPCYALTICIMSSLIFGFLLSAATVLLMHGFTNCNAELARLSASMSSSSASGADHLLTSLATDGAHHNQHLHHHHAAASLLPTPLGLADSPAATPTELDRRLGVDSGAAPLSPDDNKQLTNKTSVPRDLNATGAHFQRLPSSIVPEHYNLFISPTIAGPTFSFNGYVEIHLKCKSSTSNITLHSYELAIPESSIKLSKLPLASTATAAAAATATSTGTRGRRQASLQTTSGTPRVTKLSQDKQLQYSIIHLDAPLEVGQDYLLRLDFAGKLNDDLAGFYKMNYERANSSEPTWIAATQFQATDARRAFPCFDEPLYKATFSIKIRHWTNMTALSNMPIVNSEKSPDGLWITDTFAKSQRMSTYLVAWAVTNFESRTSGNITVWTRPGFVHTAQYALEIAGRILRHYEDFFGIAYPLPKMDMIALPDFNAGAMENWGLITYRETAMLYDPETSSVANKQRVAVVVAHELAHQWFGNLVTPKWWDDLWLNEGFASFVEYLGVDHVEPRWRMLEQFTVEEVQNVFKLDALSSSHQISIPVNNPDEISEIFDHISYAKGASIIRMMRHFITAPVFQLGLQRYLRALKYNNAEQADLWSHLRVAQQEFATRNGTGGADQRSLQDVDIDRVMNSWTLQTGYPLVTLTRRYDSPQGGAQLNQIRYQPYQIVQDANSNNNKTTSVASQNRWEIPITYTWKSEQNWEPTTRLWMRQNQSGTVEIPSSALPRDASEWIILNTQQMGYYRVNYDAQNWRLLIKQLQEDHTKIVTTNRAQLLDDLFELARSSLVDYQLAMESTKYLRQERDYLPWESVLLALGTIDEMLQRTPLYGDWQDYFAQVIEPLYARYKDLDWTKSNRTAIDSNDVLEQYNRVNAVSWACQTNNQHCIDKARRVFASWRESGTNQIQPSMRYAAYCAAIQYGTKDDWDFLWRVYEREQGAVERDRILRALGCSKEMWILARYLEWIFDKTKPIRRQDGAFVFRMIAKNNYGRDIAFNFMRERWPIIREYYGKTSFTLGHLIKSVASGMSTQVELDQLKRFHESIKNDVGTGKRSFQIAIEEVESNLYWRNKNYKILEKWLLENKREQRKPPALAA